jgi:predicted nucleic acid-binding protein
LIVLDASILIARILSEHHSGLSEDLFDLLDTSDILVPSHWPTEVANALRTNIRRGRMTEADLDAIVGLLARFRLTIASAIQISDIVPITKFSSEHTLTAYDAAYVQIALAHGGELATLDHAMRAAAKRLDIPLIPA